MRLHDLFEYQLFKSDADFKIYRNPSARDMRLLLQNSYVLSKLNIDLTAPLTKRDDSAEEEIYSGSIHELDEPLRGVIIQETVYVVDAYDTTHQDLRRILINQGLDTSEGVIKFSIEKVSLAPRGDLDDYQISVADLHLGKVKAIPAIQRMKMPVGQWKL